MKLIVLRNGQCAFVDQEDFDELNQWSWGCTSTGYAWRRVGNPAKAMYMHNVVNQTPEGFLADHINRNRLDNRRSNLRSVTRAENQVNRGTFRNNTSGTKGVHFEKSSGRWVAHIGYNNRLIKLGRFPTKAQATKARQKAAAKLHLKSTRT